MARKTTNIFNKPAGRGGEPGFQGLIPFYFKRRRPRITANPLPPYRALYHKPSLRRVGAWLESQDRFFKNALRWREFTMASFYFLCGVVVASALLFFLVWARTQPQFKNKSTKEIVVAVAARVKTESARGGS